MSFKVKALFDYASGHDDDLGFSVGQIITVTDQEDDDWYGGEYVDESGTKQEGIFPRNFVEKYEPTAPPRPTRTRPKKEPEPAPAPAPEPVAAAATPESPEHATREADDTPEPVSAPSPTETFSAPPPVPAPAAEPIAPKPVQPVQAPAPALAPAPPPPAPQPAEVLSVTSPPVPKPAPKPSGPPPVSEKPSGNSFKDRIAAFNKAAAPPVAPFKPSNLSSGGSGFIKKPFVAPPPSRNAFIPQPTQAPVARIYRREEDPDVKEQEAEVIENASKAGLVPTTSTNEGEADEDQPKPLSLKERLALLQKQQMETAARHAEAASKKEKPKRPPKKRLDSQETIEGEPAERAEEASRTSTDEAPPPRIAHPPRRRSSKGVEPRDGNEADMSGAGETTEGQEDLTEKEDSDGRPKHVATVSKQEDSDQNEEEDEEEEEEDDVDPEVRRREELRARMAKMSGGMMMPGMAMPLFGAPAPVLPKKKKAAAPEQRAEVAEESVSPVARAAPVPLPGLMRPPPPPEPKHAEPEEEEEEEEPHAKTPHQEPALPGMFVA